jgi:indolepyruvate decarboxylase
MTTVIDHVLDRLRDIAIADISGVPGDYSFPINDAICNRRDIRCSPLMTFRPRE